MNNSFAKDAGSQLWNSASSKHIKDEGLPPQESDSVQIGGVQTHASIYNQSKMNGAVGRRAVRLDHPSQQSDGNYAESQVARPQPLEHPPVVMDSHYQMANAPYTMTSVYQPSRVSYQSSTYHPIETQSQLNSFPHQSVPGQVGTVGGHASQYVQAPQESIDAMDRYQNQQLSYHLEPTQPQTVKNERRKLPIKNSHSLHHVGTPNNEKIAQVAHTQVQSQKP